MLQPRSGKAVRNERQYPHIVELAVATHELDVQLSRRIIDFHKFRQVEARHGRRVVRESQIYYRWCFSDLVTACDSAEQFGGQLLVDHVPLPPKVGIAEGNRNIRFVPIADIQTTVRYDWRLETRGITVKLARRQFFHLAAGAVAPPTASRFARAQGYPSRPVRLIVGYSAGGPLDTSARLIAQWLSERLGQPFIIENRPGAGSNLATESVVRAAPDGYTLLEVSASNAWNATLYENLNFNFIHDIVPIAGVSRAAGVMEVNPSLSAKTVTEFIAYAKANPGKVNMATAGVGSAPHLYGELFKMMAGVDLVTVNYRGSATALPDLLSGQDQVMFDVVISSIGHIRAGKLRPLGVTTTARLEVLPDVPPIGDFVPGYEASSWGGIGAPVGIPREIITVLNREVNAALVDPAFKAKLADLGAEPFANSPAEFTKFIAEFTEKWAGVIRKAGIKAE